MAKQVKELYKDVAVCRAKDRKAWRRWLEKNHASQKSVWLLLYKKNTGIPSVYYPEAVDEALCFGWIDSKANTKDAESYYQYFAKRNPNSKWSKVNKEKVVLLEQQGLMTDAGRAMIELAKEKGTWNALDDVEQIIIPDDLQKLFTKNKKAKQHWETFSRSVKRSILEWISNAKRTETRTKRIQETVTLAAQNIRANYPEDAHKIKKQHK